MLNKYPLWKNLLVAVVLLVGLLYALPNLFSQDPVIEVTGTRGEEVGETLHQTLSAALQRAQIPFKSSEVQADRLQILPTHFGALRVDFQRVKVPACPLESNTHIDGSESAGRADFDAAFGS